MQFMGERSEKGRREHEKATGNSTQDWGRDAMFDIECPDCGNRAILGYVKGQRLTAESVRWPEQPSNCKQDGVLALIGRKACRKWFYVRAGLARFLIGIGIIIISGLQSRLY